MKKKNVGFSDLLGCQACHPSIILVPRAVMLANLDHIYKNRHPTIILRSSCYHPTSLWGNVLIAYSFKLRWLQSRMSETLQKPCKTHDSDIMGWWNACKNTVLAIQDAENLVKNTVLATRDVGNLAKTTVSAAWDAGNLAKAVVSGPRLPETSEKQRFQHPGRPKTKKIMSPNEGRWRNIAETVILPSSYDSPANILQNPSS